MQIEDIVAKFSTGIFVWYNFKENAAILYLYSINKDKEIESFLKNKGNVTLCNIKKGNENIDDVKKFDYIVGVDVLEESESPVELLTFCRNHLKDDGRLLLGTENRLGIKYFCGDRDPYTNHSFDGIEDYRRITAADKKDIDGRCYSRAELNDMLCMAGFCNDKFYSVMPNLKEAQLIYADGYTPVEDLAIRYFPFYNYPDSVFLDERFMYKDLADNDLFHIMANSYFIECSPDGKFDETMHVTLSLDRGEENALVTGIYEHDGIRGVYKKAVYSEGMKKLYEMQDNLDELRRRGISVVQSKIENDKFVMPYVDKPVALVALREIAKKDKEAFFDALNDLYELILASSEHTDIVNEKDRNSANGKDMGVILSKGYIDMVALNCFYDETIEEPKKRFIFYDQEFYFENCPAKAIFYRSVTVIYDGADMEFERLIPRKEVLERFDLAELEELWQRISYRFTSELRNEKELQLYKQERTCDARVIYSNREKINYSASDYQEIFVDIFKGLDDKTKDGNNKKLVLFGSGNFTKRFLDEFAGCYDIFSIIDNNQSKWGTMMDNVPVNSPDVLRDIDSDELHLIICIKKYYGVVKQLKEMGISKYHIYDPSNEYPNKRREIAQKRAAGMIAENSGNTGTDGENEKKPYNIGYIAGVFDLFHIGHLNMFKRAKEQCNYLIVGVVSDEGVRLNKQAEPFVPFEERIEMVRSCRYVDEAVKLPLNFCGTQDMYKVYHFDVQFSGSDYEHDAYWIAQKEFLEEHGSTMVFFPYTQSTSSTKLKKAINAKIKEYGLYEE